VAEVGELRSGVIRVVSSLTPTHANANKFNILTLNHLGWPSGIGLGPGSVLLLKVSGSILSDANLRGLV